MNTLSLLYAHCGKPIPLPVDGCVFGHPIVVFNLIWAIVVIVLGLLANCYLKKKAQIKKEMAEADRKNELELKEKTFEQEKYWHDFRNGEKQDELIKALKKEVDELRNGDMVKELENNLKQKETEVELLNNQLTIFKKAIDNLKLELRTK